MKRDDVILAARSAMGNTEDFDITRSCLLDCVDHFIVLALDIPFFQGDLFDFPRVVDQLSEAACDIGSVFGSPQHSTESSAVPVSRETLLDFSATGSKGSSESDM